MTHWATGANSIVSDKPSVTTAKSRFTGFCSYYSEKKGSSLPEATKDAMNRFVRITMVDRLLVSAVKRVRSLINITGYKEVRDMLFSLRYEATTRQRFQMLFWLALTAQTALRVGAHFNNAMDPPGSPTMTFGCFVLILLAPDPSYPSTNRINLEYRHVYHKTETTYMATHTLIQSNEPWRCPVFLFLLLAYLDKIIDVPLSQLLDPAFLEGRERREVRFTGDIGSRLVCHGVTSRGRHEGWTTDHVANQLRRLSRLCGFAHNLTAHTFRRTVAIWMRIGGE
jgi:integrase